MKKYMIAALVLGLAACQQSDESAAGNPSEPVAQAKTATAFKTEEQKASYAMGLKYGEAMARDVKELDLDAFNQGVTHGFKQQKPLMEPQEIMATLRAFQTRKMQEMQQAQMQASNENKTKSEAFLNENKAREGVKTTASGLQYEVLASGSKGGISPAASDKVKVHYHGTLIDGTVFDSSVERGEPLEFAVNGVIKGWTEALQLMSKGDKWKLFIPPELAYGERGAGQKIGPNSALIFEVELLDVMKP